MTEHASGTFDVTITPQTNTSGVEIDNLSRMSIDKRFKGDLVGVSKGEMLAAATGVGGSAGYVALERVEATLRGRHGSFFLQHNATMARGVPALVVEVVPDSGTDALVGLAGRMSIEIVDGEHRYSFEYTL